MKTFLIITAMTIAATTAFGAASVRAPQIGGAALVHTPQPGVAPATTLGTNARAGTMRTQTMKASTTAPSVTASISKPIATETTGARISLLKSTKSLNQGKLKDASTTLNNIDSRIEELQSKLDATEQAQSNFLTESETYTKTEIDNLLTALKEEILERAPLNSSSGTIVVVCPDGCHPKTIEGPDGVAVTCYDDKGRPCGETAVPVTHGTEQ